MVTQDDNRILYDIDPIKKVEDTFALEENHSTKRQGVKSPKSVAEDDLSNSANNHSTNISISQKSKNVNTGNEKTFSDEVTGENVKFSIREEDPPTLLNGRITRRSRRTRENPQAKPHQKVFKSTSILTL